MFIYAPEYKARQVIASHWPDMRLPVNPASIAKRAGIEVRGVSSHALQGASGWYRPGNGKAVILFNESESETRKRFTIAHELGHHFLDHGERKRDTVSEFSLSTHDHFESDANKFAANLLMPASMVNWLVENKSHITIEGLARAFQVSDVAMRYRLKNLRLI